jgi:hypothetical protein
LVSTIGADDRAKLPTTTDWILPAIDGGILHARSKPILQKCVELVTTATIANVIDEIGPFVRIFLEVVEFTRLIRSTINVFPTARAHHPRRTILTVFRSTWFTTIDDDRLVSTGVVRS